MSTRWISHEKLTWKRQHFDSGRIACACTLEPYAATEKQLKNSFFFEILLKNSLAVWFFGTTAKPGGMRHVLLAWMDSGSLHAPVSSCINENNCVFFWKRTIVCLSKRFRAVFTKRMDLGVTLRFTKCVKKINNIHMLKIWVDCCKNCADVNMMHINRCFLVRTGIVLKYSSI